MPVPNIVLNKPQVMLVQTTSALGIENDTFGLLFGTVSLVYSTCERYVAGDVVMFSPQNAIKLIESSVNYFIVDENNIFFKEVLYP